ncbi:MAG: type I restriction enzyme HsdR N-terminal domain-containing protein [Microcoleaceae cyanobacterium MO_207.B10]|nr:type I restriction enzyme HsdR N-terminal domain-containing protein [Microcoleaceae cyanobacterium MO_207.B10]
MSNHHQINLLVEWINNFNPELLKNEDDVETKFVLPFFKLLGYPENNRRGKYPIKAYKPGKKKGRDPEADHVYFSTDNQEKQNADTSLIIVEAKKPKENLEPHIKQAKYYGEHLKSVFLVITNCYQVKVFKRHRHRKDELVFDITTDELKDKKTVLDFYEKLNFEIVKQFNENTANDLTHSQYVSLEKALQRHPDIQDILDKGDFEPSTTKGKNYLRVVKDKVAIECNLPIAFDEGDCTIEFSSIILRGSTISLTHKEILGNLMTGLNTKPQWGTRHFLRQIEDNYFEASLGRTTVILSAAETQDLCDIFDEILSEYKSIIIEAENSLETWEFEPVDSYEGLGFNLCSVSQELWELMVQFSEEFDYDEGDSDWHIFERQSYIKVSNKKSVFPHVLIFPKLTTNYNNLLSEDEVNLIYMPSEFRLEFMENHYGSWQQDVGSRGTWTATYTKKWLLEEFIPKVIDYYSGKNFNYRCKLEDTIDNTENKKIPIQEIDEHSYLVPYLREIQESIHLSTFEASLLYPYYKSFTDLIKSTDSNIPGMDYIRGKLGNIEYHYFRKKGKEYSRYEQNWNFEHAVNFLYQQVERIKASEYEDSHNADLISRTFIWILEEGNLHYSQTQLNAAKKALIPLWELSRFEERHIYPNRYH